MGKHGGIINRCEKSDYFFSRQIIFIILSYLGDFTHTWASYILYRLAHYYAKRILLTISDIYL